MVWLLIGEPPTVVVGNLSSTGAKTPRTVAGHGRNIHSGNSSLAENHPIPSRQVIYKCMVTCETLLDYQRPGCFPK